MHKFLMAVALASCVLPSFSQSSSDLLSRCLTDNTSGKDRKALARWIFVAMARHPEMMMLSAVRPTDTENALQDAGALLTRLLTSDCRIETRAAIARGGSQAFESAFRVLGEVAMQELMANPQVNSSINSIERYVDLDKIQRATGGR